MRQLDKVKDHLQSRGSINSLEAIRRYGITRLSAVIYDLRKEGHCIDSVDSVKAEGFTEYMYNFEATQVRLANELRVRCIDALTGVRRWTPQDLARICTTYANKALAITLIGR